MMKGVGSHGGGREWWVEGMRESEGRGGKSWRGKGVMEGEGSHGGTDGGEESGGAGHSFRLWAAILVGKQSFAFVGGRSQWWVVVFVHGWGVMSWALVIRMWGLSSSALSFGVMIAVLGVGLLFMGAVLSFVGGGARLRVVHVVCGWWGLSTGGVRRSWLMFVGWVVVHAWGGGSCGSLMSGVATVSLSCHCGVLCCHCFTPFIWLPRCPVGDVAPVSLPEQR